MPVSVLEPFYRDPIASPWDAFVGPGPGGRGPRASTLACHLQVHQQPLGLEGRGVQRRPRLTHPDRMKLEKYCMTFSAVRFSSGVNCPP